MDAITAAFRQNWAFAGSEHLKSDYEKLMARLRRNPDGTRPQIDGYERSLIERILEQMQSPKGKTREVL